MDDALRVRRRERAGELSGAAHDLVFRHRAARQTVGQRLGVHELKGKSGHVPALFEAVDAGNVGMVEQREELGFAAEACETARVGGQRSRQDLERDFPLQVHIPRAIDLL